jgi:predicted peptidase
MLTNCTAGKREFAEFEFEGKKLKYAIQLPDNYDSSKTYPVLVGPSEVKGKGDQSFYWKGTKDTYGWILVDYRIYNATRRVDEVKVFLDHLKSEYNVEGNKFHLVCFSANSSGIFSLAMAIPEYIEGITGMAGNPGTTNETQLSKLTGVKVQFVVGDKDTYWMNAAKQRHAILKKIGVDSSIEIIKNGPHVMGDLVGKGFLERANRLRI